ncbi:MAG TPA: hypothetical protein VF135_01675 [Terriglobales bacterium]
MRIMMPNDRLLSSMCIILLTAAVASISFMVVQKSVFAQGQVALTATIRETVFQLPTTQPRLVHTLIIARRQDGSTVRVRNVSKPDNSGVAEQRYVIDLDRREQISIDGLTGSLTTIPLSYAVAEARKKRRMCNATGDSLVRDTILGYDVVRSVQNHGATGAFVRYEEWLAPALDCFSLKTAIFHGTSDSDMHIANLREAMQVTVGEPASDLFALPSAYVERSPLQRRAEYHARYPQTAQSCPRCLEDSDRRNNETYLERQIERGK